MSTCPCCSATLLRHVRHHRVYWFCRCCWQDMPNGSAAPNLRDRNVRTLESLFARPSLGGDRTPVILHELI